MRPLLQDLRYALRLLNQHRSFTFLVALTLALGVGATTSMFSVLEAVLFPKVPVKEPFQLATLGSANAQREVRQGPISYPELDTWRSQATLFEGIEGEQQALYNLTGTAEPIRVTASRVTPGYFPLLGVTPLLGRHLDPKEDRAVLLSQELWERHFGSDRGILGRTLQLDDQPFTVIGVIPRQMWFGGHRPEIWTLLPPSTDWSRRALVPIARVKHGVTQPQMRAEMQVIAARVSAEHPASHQGWTANASFAFQPGGAEMNMVYLLLAAAASLLLVGCVNVAGLLLGRAVSRSRELAIRGAMGATRGVLIRQLLLESLLLATLGSALGLVFTLWGLDWLRSVFAPIGSLIATVELNWRVLGFGILVTFATSLVFGLVPAFQASRIDVAAALKAAGRGASESRPRRRLRQTLVIGEIALSVILLVVCGLSLRTLLLLRGIPLGFAVDGILTMRIQPAPGRVPDAPARDRYLSALLERLAELRNVSSVAAISRLPLAGGRGNPSKTLQIEGRPDLEQGEKRQPWAIDLTVTPGYFQTLSIPLLAGRDFSRLDTATSQPVAVIGQTMARRYWKGGDALGKRFRLANSTQWITVTGIAADVRNDAATEPPVPQMYLPHTQFTADAMVTVIAVKAGDPLDLAPTVRQRVHSFDPTLPVLELQTMQQVFEDDLMGPALSTRLVTTFALTALLLAVIGLYAVIAYSVSQRSQEFGVRMALGATSASLLALVTGEGTRLALAGTAAGLVGAAAVSRLMSGLIYGIQPLDPITFSSVALLTLVMGIAASLPPSVRAGSLSPLEALRND